MLCNNQQAQQQLFSEGAEASPKAKPSVEPQSATVNLADGQEEKWLPITGADGWFEVSSWGRIRRSYTAPVTNSTRGGRILSAKPESAGYMRVSLYVKNGRQIRAQVHRLVAKEFVPGFESGRQINHKNGIKTDNRIENLEWVTPRENVIHAWRTGLTEANTGENHGAHKITEHEAKAILVLLANGVRGRLLGVAFGVTEAAISAIKKGKSWKHLQNV